jgi:hypothetical protein
MLAVIAALSPFQASWRLKTSMNFLNISAGVPNAVIIFDSPGGATLAGIKIGEIIRLKHYNTFVKHDTMCASACGLAGWGVPIVRSASVLL